VSALRLDERFIHLGRGGRAAAQPAFDGMAWYEAYDARHGSDGPEGRLVSQYAFAEDWAAWEMHPAGEEVVICIAGALVLLQEDAAGQVTETALAAGEYAINPPGVWHTANVAEGAVAIFITPGEGTQHRPRQPRSGEGSL
jgi:quercetin dioxygenase-like cupin family protein